MSKETYLQKVRPQLVPVISSQELSFLDWYAQLSKAEMEYVLQSQIENNDFYPFSQWIKAIVPDEYLTKVDKYQWHNEHLKTSALSSAMKVVTMEKISTYHVFDRSELPPGLQPDVNYIDIDQGKKQRHFSLAIAPNKVYMVCRVFVMVLENRDL